MIREMTIDEKSNAPIAPKLAAIRDGDDELFKPVAKVAQREPRIIASGTAFAGQPVVIKTVDISEAELLSATLDALRSGKTQIIAPMDSETMNAIGDEPIGVEHSTTPFQY